MRREARAFVELDDTHDVRRCEARDLGVHLGPRVHDRGTAAVDPRDRTAAADAERSRIELVAAARVAALDREPSLAGGLPERLRVRVAVGLRRALPPPPAPPPRRRT